MADQIVITPRIFRAGAALLSGGAPAMPSPAKQCLEAVGQGLCDLAGQPMTELGQKPRLSTAGCSGAAAC